MNDTYQPENNIVLDTYVVYFLSINEFWIVYEGDLVVYYDLDQYKLMDDVLREKSGDEKEWTRKRDNKYNKMRRDYELKKIVYIQVLFMIYNDYSLIV